MVFALALPEAFRAVHLTPEAHRALFRRVARSNLVAVFVPSSCRAREPDLTAAFRDALVTACQEHSDEAPIEKGRWRTLTHCIQSRVSLSPLKGGSLLSAPVYPGEKGVSEKFLERVSSEFRKNLRGSAPECGA